MNSNIAISVEGVSKKFCRSLKRSMAYGLTDIGRNLLGCSSLPAKERKEEFWAVDNVSFQIQRGESFGLIGPNGSGKTTLLKMLNGIFWPDRGRIEMRGRVGALIAVGAGFHPMLTGRENVYINGAILGMNKREIDQKFDAIVDFADIGEFIDAPVKHYSSGMFVRLGFAVAVHGNPEVLLIDEVLAVGDKDFQMKCYRKINEIRTQGTTVILVAHNEYTIREYTNRCAYLNHGKERFIGSSEEGISLYMRDILELKSKQEKKSNTPGFVRSSQSQLLPVKFLDAQGRQIDFLESGQELNILFECVLDKEVQNPVFGVNFYDNAGFMYCVNSSYEGFSIPDAINGHVRIKIQIPHLHLPMNNYLVSTIIAEGNPDNLLDWHDREYRFVVGRAENARGSIKLPTLWSVEK